MIKAIRERLELTQEQAGEVIGGGRRAFQKYETGEVRPASSVEKLLLVLNQAPSLARNLQGPLPRMRSSLPPTLAITEADITKLSPRELQDAVRMMITAEANVHCLEHSWLHVPSQTDAPDGGVDGKISWRDGPASTPHLPARTVVFQNKATAMSPAKCVKEVLAGTQLKPVIREVLERGGVYVLAVARSMTQPELDKRLNAMREKLRQLGHPEFAERMHLYSAAQLAAWANSYPSAALALRDRLGNESMFRGFDSWAGRSEHALAFETDERLAHVSRELLGRLKDHQQVARLVGLSGRGKSRLAIEAFLLQSSDAQRLRSKLIYADAGGAEHDVELGMTVQRLIDQNAEALIVVENCTQKTHARLASMVRGEPNRLALLTIDMDTTNYIAAETIEVHGMSDATTDRLVRAIAPKLDDTERRRIVKYSAGFPQMARLLAEAALGSKNLASCSDLHLARLFVLGRDGDTDGKTLLVARIISLLGLIRIDGDDDEELRYLHETFDAPAPDVLRQEASRLVKRGVVQRRGGLLLVAPRPIALALAMDLWTAWSKSRVKLAFLQPHNPRLYDSMLRQFARLDGFPDAIALAGRILDIDGPFDTDETLSRAEYTEAVSALSEVVPEKAVALLETLFSRSTREQIKRIKGDARRNLVNGLVKMAFRKATFERAALLLLELAVAENETWGNNATGVFKRLFPIVFGDTEAGLVERLRLTKRILKSNLPENLIIAVEAVDKALETGNFTRFVGPEFQGSESPLRCWQPSTIAEQREYFSSFLEIQSELACRSDAAGDLAYKLLGRRLFGLIQIGMLAEVERCATKVQTKRAGVWVAAIDSLRHLLAHPKRDLSPEAEAVTRRLLKALGPADLRDELRLTVSQAPWDLYDEEDEDKTLTLGDRIASRAIALARRVATQPSQLEPLLPALLAGEQRQAFAFGSTLIQHVKQRERLLTAALEALTAIPPNDRNISLIGGIVHGLVNDGDALADTTILRFKSHADLRWAVPYLTAVAGVTVARLPLIIELARTKQVGASHFCNFAAGRALSELSADQVSPLFLALIHNGGEYLEVAIELIGMYVFRRMSHLDKLRPVLRDLYGVLPGIALSGKRGSTSGHHLKDITAWLLEQGQADQLACHAAIKLAQQLTAKAGTADSYDYDGTNQEIVRLLLRHFGSIVWPILSDALLAQDIRSVRFEHVLGDRLSLRGEQKPPILELPSALLMAWCEANPEAGPAFLARVLPTLEKGSDGTTTWHPAVRQLIDSFGKSSKFRDALHAAMHTFGWSGSLTTYYSLYLPPLQELADHPLDEVRLWATTELSRLRRTIDREHNRDAEQEVYFDA